MNKKRFGILFLAALLACCVSWLEAAGVSAGSGAVTIPVGQESVKLYAPFEITSALMCKDGGTIVAVIKDSKGTKLPVCFDGRIKVPQEERFLYAGISYPDASKKIEPGSSAEKSILETLKSAKISSANPENSGRLVKSLIDKIENR